jgi:hypothetical protein
LLDYQSKKQQIFTLSSCEAELVSYTKRSQNAIFVQLLLGEILGEEPPSTIFEDNAGCIYLIRNEKTGSRTKQIAVRHLFGKELFSQKKPIPTLSE